MELLCKFAKTGPHSLQIAPNLSLDPLILRYFLVTVMTCSCLAAIMSTADSALMGVSSIVSLDLVKRTWCPEISRKNVVRVGEMNSVLVCCLAFALGTFLDKDQMGCSQ